MAKKGNQPKVAREDLTRGDDDGEMMAAPVNAEPRAYEWPVWVREEKTGEMQLQVQALRPYVRSVEDLWHRLCEADVPVPRGKMMANLDAYAGCAVKLLFLLCHAPEEYAHLRSTKDRFLMVIDEWGNLNVPREKTVEAVTLALKIHNEQCAKTLEALAHQKARA